MYAKPADPPGFALEIKLKESFVTKRILTTCA